MSHCHPPPKWFCGGGLPPHEQSMASVYSRNVRLSTEKSLLQSCRASVRAVENQEGARGPLTDTARAKTWAVPTGRSTKMVNGSRLPRSPHARSVPRPGGTGPLLALLREDTDSRRRVGRTNVNQNEFRRRT